MMTNALPGANTCAIVIGGSIAGLLTARVVADHFEQVILIERDILPVEAITRKGTPQARHVHALLPRGFVILSQLFPALPARLQQLGAISGDIGATVRWYHSAGYRQQFHSGLTGIGPSRPLLEQQIRLHVLALPNVSVLTATDVLHPIISENGTRVTGVAVRSHTTGTTTTLNAALVIDASGRGSQSPAWLESWNYQRPPEQAVKVNLGYASRVYRRSPDDLVGAQLLVISNNPPHGKRSGVLSPIEDERWIVTLAGWLGDHPPADEAGFLAYAGSLPTPDLFTMLRRIEPISDIAVYKFPANLRRHYEQLTRFPEGYLVLGDAQCSFNPVYGQGMTSAALQANTLHELLSERHLSGLDGLAASFFKRTAKILDIPWRLAVGEDFRYPDVEGQQPTFTPLLNRYGTLVHKATQHDTVVYSAFLKVMNLMAPPAILLKPQIVWRVLRAARQAPTK